MQIEILVIVLISVVNCQDYRLNGNNWNQGICKTGQHQSPIDVSQHILLNGSQHMYLAMNSVTSFSLLQAVDTQIQSRNEWVNFFAQDSNNRMRTYSAQSFNFHTPSEHYLDGKQYDLEMRINCVETETSKQVNLNLNRRQGQIVILFIKKDNYQSKMFNMINFQNINSYMNINFYDALYPLLEQYNKEKKAQKSTEQAYFLTYEGSQTKGNCEETVSYYILNTVFEIGTQQLKYLQDFLRTNPNIQANGGNNRALQTKGTRKITKGIVKLPIKRGIISGIIQICILILFVIIF